MFKQLLEAVADQFIFPVIALLGAVALLVFLWGIVEFIRDASSDEGREKGKRHMTYGIIGLFIMTTAWALINVIANTIPGEEAKNAIPTEFQL